MLYAFRLESNRPMYFAFLAEKDTQVLISRKLVAGAACDPVSKNLNRRIF